MQKRKLRPRRVPGVRLVDEGSTEQPKVGEAQPEVRWIHVANSGDYRGHGYGPFVLTRGVFESFVKNLRSDPQYRLGKDGKGEQPVIQYDYEHASESSPTSGTIPINGAPAPAWVLDLEVRVSTDDHEVFELWALTRLGQQIREQIERGEYRFVSIAFVENSKDPVTGEPTGPRLTSIAFTNQPFIRDLSPLAASARAALSSLEYVSPAGTPEEAFAKVRECLRLPVSLDNPSTLAEIQKILAWAATPDSAPVGVELELIISALRTIFGLPVTSTLEEIGAAASAAANPPDSAETSTPAPAAVMRDTMNEKIVAKILSRIYGRTIQFADADEAADAVKDAATAQVDLAKILEALGVQNATAALAALPELMKAKTMLAEVQKQLEAAMAVQNEVAAARADAEIDAVMATHKMPANTRVALKNFREKDPEGFAKEYPLPPKDREHLLRSIIAGAGGRQFEAPKTLRIDERGDDGAGDAIDLRPFAGRNATEKAMSYLRETNKAAVQWSQDRLLNEASALKRSGVRLIVE